MHVYLYRHLPVRNYHHLFLLRNIEYSLFSNIHFHLPLQQKPFSFLNHSCQCFWLKIIQFELSKDMEKLLNIRRFSSSRRGHFSHRRYGWFWKGLTDLNTEIGPRYGRSASLEQLDSGSDEILTCSTDFESKMGLSRSACFEQLGSGSSWEVSVLDYNKGLEWYQQYLKMFGSQQNICRFKGQVPFVLRHFLFNT